MIILLPLADGEQQRITLNNLNNKVIQIHTSDCTYPFNHIFFAEVGKLLHFWKTNKENFDNICFIQNRRYFKDLNNINKIEPNKVYLAKKENVGPIKLQFQNSHPPAKNIFENILNKIEINKNLLNERGLSPHNIFISDKTFFNQYCEFLNENLIPIFDPKFDKKYGAFISERLLHLFAYSNFNVIEKEIIILPK